MLPVIFALKFVHHTWALSPELSRYASRTHTESYKSRMTTAMYRQGRQEFIVVIFCKNAKTWVPAHDPEPTVSVTLLLRACACTAPCDDAAHTRSMAQHGRQVHTRRIKSAPHGHFSFNNAFIMLVQTMEGELSGMRIPLHSCAAVPLITQCFASSAALQRYLGLSGLSKILK